jgi:hypothetical protein
MNNYLKEQHQQHFLTHNLRFSMSQDFGQFSCSFDCSKFCDEFKIMILRLKKLSVQMMVNFSPINYVVQSELKQIKVEALLS